MSANSAGSLLARGRERLKSSGISGYSLDAEVLLRHVTGLGRAALLAGPEREVGGSAAAEYDRCLRLREERVPVAYITNSAEFMSLPMYIDRRALIPRPDTETLAESALGVISRMEKTSPGGELAVLELCTGSGCVALALARYAPRVRVTASDISEGALELARENALRLGLSGRVEFVRGDLFGPVRGRKFDMIAANPPYIPTDVIDTLDGDVRLYEPRGALDGGGDGLSFYRRLCSDAPAALNHGGAALFEIGYDQGEAVSGLMAAAGFRTEIIKDLPGHDRVVIGLL